MSISPLLTLYVKKSHDRQNSHENSVSQVLKDLSWISACRGKVITAGHKLEFCLPSGLPSLTDQEWKGAKRQNNIVQSQDALYLLQALRVYLFLQTVKLRVFSIADSVLFQCCSNPLSFHSLANPISFQITLSPSMCLMNSEKNEHTPCKDSRISLSHEEKWAG